MASYLLTTFRQQVQQHPDAIAVQDGARQISYHQLDRDSRQLATQLKQGGIGRDSIVGVFIERSYEMVLAVVSILRAGGCYLPLDPAYPTDRLQYMLRDAKAALVLSMSSMNTAQLAFDGSVLLLDQIASAVASTAIDDTTRDNTTQPDDLAYIIYTSGSTGLPKGVAMVHRPLEHLMRWQLPDSRLPQGAATLQFAPLSFDVSFQEIFATFCSGGKLVIIQDEQRLNGGELLRFIEKNQINRLFLPFVALQFLAEAAVQFQRFPSSLREVVTAGEALQINKYIRQLFAALPGARLQNQYGPSETHVVTAYDLEGDVADWPALPPIGKALPHVLCLILDDKLQPVKPGDEGELYLGGETLARGYLHKPELTAERFLEINGEINGQRVYKTGDLARQHADSEDIDFLGRKDGQVKVRGYRIELGEIDVALCSHPAVTQALVDVRRNEVGDKKLVAYLIAGNITVTALREYLEQSLPDYMVPTNFVFLKEFPRTPSGKIDRRSLPDVSRERPPLATDYQAPASDYQKKLAKAWESLLEVAPIGIDDNFFDLGGNSLLALRFIDWLKIDCDVDLSPVDMFQHPTIRNLAQAQQNRAAQHRQLDAILSKHGDKTASSRDDLHDIAIIGMAVRLPGANTVEAFWNNLVEGRESIRRFSRDELLAEANTRWIDDPKYVPVKAVIDKPGHFDARFFGISPREAEVIDPQQRVFLEVAWSALEDGGYTPQQFKGEIGVYAGTANNSYFANNITKRPELIDRIGSFTVMTGNEKDYVTTRAAHRLNLTGPAVSVHSACSTSLVAVHLAVRALRGGECDMAIAGGASVSAPQCEGYLYQEGGMLSADGHCRPFDADATGTTFSDGAGAVLLKPLQKALADGDHIYGVIKGTAINNDGGDKASFSAPNALGQSKVILMAQRDAGISASELGYIEAHGTATPLGDPIEVQALADAFHANGDNRANDGNSIVSNSHDSTQRCVLGSVKSNFGHLTAAAGIAGLIKTTLAVGRGTLPPTLHFRTPNPTINWNQTPFRVNASAEVWPAANRVAGISSFGVGGTNAHVIVAQPPARQPSGAARPWQLLPLSHQSVDGLQAQEVALAAALPAQQSLADVAYTLQTGRNVYREMAFVIADRPQTAIDALNNRKAPLYRRFTRDSTSSQIAFAFPGQGTQMSGMGQALYEAEAVYQQTVDQCATLLQSLLGEDIRALLYPSLFNTTPDDEKLGQTLYTQLSLFITEYALAQLWRSWGVEPVAMIGHSIGEWVAACVAGTVTAEGALTAVFHRGRLMQAQTPGDMLSVRADEATVRAMLPPTLDFAAINSPMMCVVAGKPDDIAAFSAECESRGIVSKLLITSHAFHSRMMEPALDEFATQLSAMTFSKPRIPFISSVTGNWITDAEACSPQYWASHIRNPVRFADGVVTLSQRAPLLVLELGPRSVLSGLINQNRQRSEPCKAVPVLSNGVLSNEADKNGDWQTLLGALAQTIASGAGVDWSRFHGFANRQRLSLPTYRFDGVEYWIKPPATPVSSSAGSPVQHIDSTAATPAAAPTSTLLDAVPTGNVMSARNELIKSIINIVEDASGFDLAGASDNEHFLELGLDSLVLTQMATSLKGRFEVDISFRQLMEQFTSVGALADHLLEQMPADQLQALAPAAAVPIAAAPAMQQMAYAQPLPMASLIQDAGNAAPGSLEHLIRTQLAVMSQQLDLLRGGAPMAMPLPAVATTAALAPAAAQPAQAAGDDKPVKKAFGAQAKIETTRTEGLTVATEDNVRKFVAQYAAKTPLSKATTQANRAHLADPRVVSGFKPLIKEMVYPIVVKGSSGSKLWDIDGHEYVDLVNGFGTNFLGHAPEYIKQALHAQIDIGLEIGPQTPLAAEVAKLMCDIIGMDRAAMCNTGSEAVIGAIRLARTVTGRNKIVMFDGAYHGINDEEIVRATKSGKSVPAAAGIPPESVANVVILDYGTDEALEWIRANSKTLAAVLVEPVQSRRPDFQPGEFLKTVREITEKTGTALIFDEVITGFRIRPGGAQEYFGIRADLATYGKIIGGGMPIGAIVGNRKFMDALDGGYWQFGDDSIPEVGVTYFAGTFIRHPLTMAAAKAALSFIQQQGGALQEQVNQKAQGLFDRVNEYYHILGLPFKLKNFGSLFKIWFDETQPLAGLLFYKMRELGVHVWEGRPCFITVAHTPEDIALLEKCFKEAGDFMLQNGFVTPLAADHNGHATPNEPALAPPAPNAKLGRDPQGNPGWYIEDDSKPGSFIRIGDA